MRKAAALLAVVCLAASAGAQTPPWEQQAALVSCALRSGAEDLPDRPFETDVCSLWPDGWWGEGCIAHDRDYWCGGTSQERLESDWRLAQCVGGPVGLVMFLGVRVGGVGWLPTPYRWGYGRTWPETRAQELPDGED